MIGRRRLVIVLVAVVLLVVINFVLQYVENEAVSSVIKGGVEQLEVSVLPIENNATFSIVSAYKVRKEIAVVSNYERMVINTTSSTLENGARLRCVELQMKYHVIPNQSWGIMRDETLLREEWKTLDCNFIITLNGTRDCSTVAGRRFIENMVQHHHVLCPKQSLPPSQGVPDDAIKARSYLIDTHHSSFCKMDPATKLSICYFDNLMLNMSLLSTKLIGNDQQKKKRKVREFAKGCFQFYCPTSFHSPVTTLTTNIPGFHSSPIAANITSPPYIMTTPVLIVSHDFIFNLGHLMEDLLNWFLVSEVMQNITLKELTIFNIDGLRPGTIHNGNGRFYIDPKQPDTYGRSYSKIFDVLFGRKTNFRMLRNEHVGKLQTILFSKGAYLFASNTHSFLWESFEHVDRCSLELQPSYIHRKFAVTYMNAWLQHGHLEKNIEKVNAEIHPKHPAVVSEHHPKLRVLLIDRPLLTSAIITKQARTFANHEAIDSHFQLFCQQYPHIAIYAIQLESLPFEEQVALMYQMDVIIGFHGAGIMHMFHFQPPELSQNSSSIPNKGGRYCCSIIEIFPQEIGCERDGIPSDLCLISKRKGHANMARYLGFQYHSIIAKPYSYVDGKGTIVEPNTITEAMKSLYPDLFITS